MYTKINNLSKANAYDKVMFIGTYLTGSVFV
jgi:hypothetical protein